MNRIANIAFIVLATLFAVLHGLSADVTQKEVDVGREAAAEYDKGVKLVTDPAMVDRVNRVGQAVVKAAGVKLDVKVEAGKEKPDLPFIFKIVDDKDVNAFAMPGGFVYVNTGLLTYVQSDDELAGVLAHEVTHVKLNHAIKRDKKYNKGATTIELATLLALILAKDKSAEDVYNVSYAASLVNIAKTMEYSQTAELEADQGAIDIMQKTGYRPVAMLTIMDRFTRDENRSSTVDMGFLRSHPPSKERSQAIEDTLHQRHIATDKAARRAVTTLSVAKAEEVKVGDHTLQRVMMNGQEIVRVPTVERANQIVVAINKALDDGMEVFDIQLSADAATISNRRTPLVTLTPEDSAVADGNPPLPNLTQQVYKNLRVALTKGDLENL